LKAVIKITTQLLKDCYSSSGMKIKLILPALIITLYHAGYSNNLNLHFSHLTTGDGLSNNTVHCVLQDSKGFLWFGTDDGLNMYDGYNFKIFFSNINDTLSIAGNAVFKVKEDSRGNLWIATENGIDIFNRDLLYFEHIPFIQEDSTLLYQDYVRDIFEDDNGNILAITAADIFIYDTLIGGFTDYLGNIDEYRRFQKDGIRSYIKDRKNRIWVGSITFGLFAYDLSNEKIIASPVTKSSINITDKVFTIVETDDGNIWIGTDNGIYEIKSDLSEVNLLKANGKKNRISSNNIICIFQDCKNRIWIGTDGGGLNLYNSKKNTFSVFDFDDFDRFSINNNSIRAIFEDKQGILWLGTYQGGVNFAQLDVRQQITHYKNEPGNYNSLIYNAVAAIYEDKKGNLWIGTDGGGLDFYNTKTKKYKHYIYKPGLQNSINGKSVLTIAEDKNGKIWIGGYLTGINVIDQKTGRIKSYKHNPSDTASLSDNDVRDICVDRNNNIWIATNGGGLNKFDPETNSFIHYKEGGPNSLVRNWCLKIFEDSYGYLWIGTYGGLSIFDPENNAFRNYVRNNNPGSLSNNWIYSFAEDSLGNIWIGTAKGLNYFDRNSRSFTVFTIADGLPNDVINGILIDNNNNLWLSTNKGISRFNHVSGSIKNLDLLDGLQGNQFIHGSYYISKSGKMYFGGLNGYNSFYPDDIQDNKFIPPVYITDLLIYFKQMQINEEGSPLTKSITETDKIILTHNQSVITFRYTALNYLNSEKNQYAYRLEGFDKGWNNVGTRREVTFTNLDPGSYVFRIKASNDDGIWNEEGKSIAITILPPWWKTLIFKIAALLLILTLLVGFYFYRLSQLNKQRIQLEKLIRERTSEIEEKNRILTKQAAELNETNSLLEERQQKIEEQTEELLAQKENLEEVNAHLKELNSTKDKFFSIIAHDLKNPFNTILGFSELLNMKYDTLSEEKKLRYMEVIFSSSKNIYNLLENLLQWARTQTDKIAFEPIVFSLKQLVEQNINLLKENITTKNIKIGHKITDSCNVYADRNMINTVVRNLLTNAIKFTRSGGDIAINTLRKNGHIEISVKDSGIGMSAEETEKIFRVDANFSKSGTDGETGTGLGLILCKEFIIKNGGKIWVESDPGKGSRFLFTLPAAK
jgi:signal transduction histidine kinase/ligand-binding sensor domain-containing protein